MIPKTIIEILKLQEQLNKYAWTGNPLNTTVKVLAERNKTLTNSSIQSHLNFEDKNLAESSSFLQLQKIFQKNVQSRIIKGNPLLAGNFGNIFLNQVSIIDSVKRMVSAFQFFPFDKNLLAFSNVLGALTNKIASRAFFQFDNASIKVFENITTQAAELISDAKAKDSNSDVERIERFFNHGIAELKEQIKKGEKSTIAVISLWLTIFSILLTIFLPIINPYISDKHSSNAQGEEIQKNELFDKFESLIKSLTKTKVIRIKCWLKIKPTKNCQSLYLLTPGMDVSIITVYHKWANISFIDPKDNLPIIGWVLKKYLMK